MMSLPSDPLKAAIDGLRRESVDVASVTWDEFVDSFRWEQGEHVALIGPTGSGKTTLALSLLQLRKYVTIFATKPKDSTLDKLLKRGYRKITKWTDSSAKRNPRRILWPNAKNLYAAANQHRTFKHALAKIYIEGGWCVYMDELWMMIHALKLEFEVRMYLQQARSLGISLVCATQRPKRVPLEIFDQSSHLFFWRDNDEQNLTRISGIAWLNAITVREAVANLDLHEVLYIYTRNSHVRMVKFYPPNPADKKG